MAPPWPSSSPHHNNDEHHNNNKPTTPLTSTSQPHDLLELQSSPPPSLLRPFRSLSSLFFRFIEEEQVVYGETTRMPLCSSTSLKQPNTLFDGDALVRQTKLVSDAQGLVQQQQADRMENARRLGSVVSRTTK
ncbi:hypothetical protein Sjap_009031 [Stephania japonica]|uniref:Uncharacterized protein n=1 Tax=Stephania japonica TaxID=461633 RepID=A0AAP0JT28_9MAGN